MPMIQLVKTNFSSWTESLKSKLKKLERGSRVAVKEVDNDDDARMLTVYLTYTPQANTI